MQNNYKLQITSTLLIIEMNKNKTAHGGDVSKFKSTISPFRQENLIHLVLLFQNTSISNKFSNVLLNVLTPMSE